MIFRQSTVAEASLLLLNDLNGIEMKLEMMLPRFSSTGCRIQPLYRSTPAVSLQLLPFLPREIKPILGKGKLQEQRQGITYEMKSAFYDCFYVMPPLKKGHYTDILFDFDVLIFQRPPETLIFALSKYRPRRLYWSECHEPGVPLQTPDW